MLHLNVVNMNTAFDNISIIEVSFPKDKIEVTLSDGRSVAVPLSWFPKLSKAPDSELQLFEISPKGYGIHWPKLDEDISIKSFI